MRVLSVASEFFPLIKTGGLADVAGALPAALAAHQVEMRTLLPGYPAVKQQLAATNVAASFDDLFGGSATLKETAYGSNATPLLILDAPHLYDRLGNPYLGKNGKDWPDNHFRFAWVASRVGLGLIEGWRPEVIHGHDWQAGLTPAYLHDAETRPATLLTIHNLAFQGLFPANLLGALRLPRTSFSIEGLEYYGQISFLKGGLIYADHLSTVSPTYAREICTPAFGAGLEGVLRQRRDVLTGITNGIDADVWNPETDPNIASPYSGRTVDAKAANKTALQQRFDRGQRCRRRADIDPCAPARGWVAEALQQSAKVAGHRVAAQETRQHDHRVAITAGKHALPVSGTKLAKIAEEREILSGKAAPARRRHRTAAVE